MNQDSSESDASNLHELAPPRASHYWRLWLGLTVFTAIEAFALLHGAHVLPYVRGFVGFVWFLAWMTGLGVESHLLIVSGRWAVSDGRPFDMISRAMALGAMYIVPPIYASAGRFIGWTLPVSALMFVGLLVRVRLIWTKRTHNS